MTKKVISVMPEESLMKAVEILLNNNFNGLPVVSRAGKVVGILTEYDLMIRGSGIYLPTLIKLVQDFKIYGKDKKAAMKDISNLINMQVADAMNPKPTCLNEDDTLSDAVEIFSRDQNINPIPIVRNDGKLVGIISRFDLIKIIGCSAGLSHESEDERSIDQNVNKFLDNFEDNFILVNKKRTEYWLLMSLMFTVVGFMIAFMIIVRISFD